jgi:ParB-like chromosome segregation protein Spo0J
MLPMSHKNVVDGHHRVVAATKAGVNIPPEAIYHLPGKTQRAVFDW